MKRFIPTLLISMFIVFNTVILESAPAENCSKPSSDTSEKFTTLYSFSGQDNKNINIVTTGNGVYITSCVPQKINSNDFSLIKQAPVSSKVLVNSEYSLGKGYIPKNLTGISPEKVKLEYEGLKLIPDTLNALYSMIDAAKKDKINGFIINSAYRSESTQKQIFDANLNTFRKNSKSYEEAYKKTRLLVALPGNSEHQTGLAADIFSVNGRHRSDFPGTKEQVWLDDNLYKYGFIIRYPADKTKETQSTYEPWHIRYVGIPLSRFLMEKNLCLEEFYKQIFEGTVMANSTHIFLKINSGQKAYIDKNMLSNTRLEFVKESTLLLTISKSQ